MLEIFNSEFMSKNKDIEKFVTKLIIRKNVNETGFGLSFNSSIDVKVLSNFIERNFFNVSVNLLELLKTIVSNSNVFLIDVTPKNNSLRIYFKHSEKIIDYDIKNEISDKLIKRTVRLTFNSETDSVEQIKFYCYSEEERKITQNFLYQIGKKGKLRLLNVEKCFHKKLSDDHSNVPKILLDELNRVDREKFRVSFSERPETGQAYLYIRPNA